MSDDNTNEETARETVTVALDDIKAVVRETVEETVTERLEAEGLGKVDRSNVAVKADGDDDQKSPSRFTVAPAFERMYRSLPEWEREIRSPEIDHHISDWALGLMHNNHARMARAHDAIAQITGQRDLNTSDDSALIPAPLADVIVTRMQKEAVIGPRSRRFTSESTTLAVPTETTFQTAEMVLEAGAATPTDRSTGTVTLTKVKTVVSTRSSVEFIEDNAFNAVSFLSEGAAKAIALQNDAQDMTLGDGSADDQTDALENNGSITEVDASVGTLAYADMVTLWYSLLSQYRRGAVWMAGNLTIKEIAQIEDLNGRPIFTPGMNEAGVISGGQGAPGVGTIFGRPVLEVPASAGVMFLGDLNYYGVLEHGQIRAEFSRDEAFLTDELTWKWVQRRDGAVLQAEAFKKFGGITEA